MEKEIKDIIESLGINPDDVLHYDCGEVKSIDEVLETLEMFYDIPYTFKTAMINSIFIYRYSDDILKNLKKKKRDYIRNSPILYEPEVVTDCMEYHKRAEFLVECEIMAREYNIWEY